MATENAKILIVEDEIIVAMELASSLQKMNYTIVGTADSGQKAIDLVLAKKPNLLLMDIHIKGSMDGIETANHIRSLIDIPIIFLTAFAESDKLERAKLALPFGYLLKPVQPRDLQVTIEIALYVSRVNAEKNQAQEELKKAHENLENKVEERTQALLREIEIRKQIEEQLQSAKFQAEAANDAKTVFLANISHELRNPMHQIISYSKFGDEKYENLSDAKRKHYFRQIRKSSDRLMVLLNNLLDLSKMESGRMDFQIQENNLEDIIREAIAEFKPTLEEKKMAVELENKTAAETVACDAYKIGQVIRNLLANAINYSPESKNIKINVIASEETDNDLIQPTIKVSVKDEGVGIPENELEEIFCNFNQSSRTRTNAGGTGLGLAICREIITAHRGKIWAENNRRGGATISFLLPIDFEY